MIPTNEIDNLDSLYLHNDFVNLPNRNGLLIFFYDIQDENFEWNQLKMIEFA